MQWTEDGDLIIAEKMLQGTREGKNKMHIYKELSDKLQCDISECKDRWEKHLASRYKMAMQLAEKFYTMTVIRKKPQEVVLSETLKLAIEKKPEKTENTTKRKYNKKQKMVKNMKLSDVISYLQSMEEAQSNEDEMKELKELKEENNKLKEEMRKMELDYKKMEEDYQVVMSIIQRANHILEVG